MCLTDLFALSRGLVALLHRKGLGHSVPRHDGPERGHTTTGRLLFSLECGGRGFVHALVEAPGGA